MEHRWCLNGRKDQYQRRLGERHAPEHANLRLD